MSGSDRSQEFSKPATAQTSEANLLDLQIKRHKRADSNGSYLGKTVDWVSGLVWNKDADTLAAMETMSAQIDKERRAGNQAKVAEIEKGVKELVKADRAALGWRQEITHYGTGFVKSAGLFMPGAAGKVASVISHGLDQAHCGDPLSTQLVDGSLGATKGLVLSKAFSMLGGSSFSAPLKGVLMGTGSAGIDLTLNRRSYLSADGRSFDLNGGLSKVVNHVTDPAVWLADGGAFVVAHGLSGMLGTATGGYIQNSRLLSTALTGTSFGLTNGALGEVQRQRAAGEEIDFGKVAIRSLLQGGLDTVAALPGGVVGDSAFRGSVRKWFEGSQAAKNTASSLEVRSPVDRLALTGDPLKSAQILSGDRLAIVADGAVGEQALKLGRELPSREQLEQAVRDGWIDSQKATVDGRDLTIYNYSRRAQSELHWEPVVSAARGLIVCDKTGEVVALPLEKFFEIGERTSRTERAQPGTGPFDAFVKMDGSLGIMYRAGRKVHWSTRGQLQSDNAKVAEAIWNSKYSQHDQLLCGELNHLSIVAEIIHPKTQVVCRYGFADLVLLAARNRFNGQELPYEEVSAVGKKLGMPVVERVPFATVEQVLAQAKKLDDNHEGYVLRWPDGYRLKVKGAEYERLHALLSDYNNSYAADNWLQGSLPKALRDVPAGFHGEVKRQAAALDETLVQSLDLIDAYYKDAPKQDARSFTAWTNEAVPEALRSQLQARQQLDRPETGARLARLSLAASIESGRLSEVLSSPADHALRTRMTELEQGLARYLWERSRTVFGDGQRQLNQLIDKVPQPIRGALHGAIEQISPATSQQQLITYLREQAGKQNGPYPVIEEIFKNASAPDSPGRLHRDWTSSQPAEIRSYLDRWRAAGRFETAENAARCIVATAVRKGQVAESLAALESALNLRTEGTAVQLQEFEGRLSRLWDSRPQVARQALLIDWAKQSGADQPIRQLLLEQAWAKQRAIAYEQYLKQIRSKPAASDTNATAEQKAGVPVESLAHLKLPAPQSASLAELQQRMEGFRTESAVFRFTKPDAVAVFDSRADYLASATDALPVAVRVYKVKGHSTEIVVPEEYARELDLVRAARLKLAGHDVPLKDVPNIRLLDRALPEDFIPLLDSLPNSSLVRQLILDPNRNAVDSWHAHAEKDSTFRSVASASEDGTRITFFQKDLNGQILSELQHEWSHLFRKQVPIEARLFDIAGTLEKDGFTGRDQRVLSDPHERWAALLGERFMAADPADFAELCRRAPIQTVMLTEALNRSMLYMDRRLQHDLHSALNERLCYVKESVRPVAVRSLVEQVSSSPNLAERGNALRVLLQLGEAGRLRDLRVELTISLSGEPIGDSQLRQLKDVPIESLDLAYTGATNLAFASGSNLLKTADLSGSKIKSSGLSSVGSIKSLERLILANTEIDDGAVYYLQRATNLRLLDLSNTRISQSAVERLRTALPACKIIQ